MRGWANKQPKRQRRNNRAQNSHLGSSDPSFFRTHGGNPNLYLRSTVLDSVKQLTCRPRHWIAALSVPVHPAFVSFQSVPADSGYHSDRAFNSLDQQSQTLFRDEWIVGANEHEARPLAACEFQDVLNRRHADCFDRGS